MITVRNVLELPVFDNVRLAAPCERYLDRPVINCGTLEGEPFFHDYDMFVPGEFIFTSLGFAQIHPELAEEAMLALIERDVAALAIKPYAIKDLPDTVRQASTRRGVPVFFYDGRYMERILASAMALIDSDAADSGRSQLIDQLLAPSDERQRWPRSSTRSPVSTAPRCNALPFVRLCATWRCCGPSGAASAKPSTTTQPASKRWAELSPASTMI